MRFRFRQMQNEDIAVFINEMFETKCLRFWQVI